MPITIEAGTSSATLRYGSMAKKPMAVALVPMCSSRTAMTGLSRLKDSTTSVVPAITRHSAADNCMGIQLS